jgi:hypothetical protein
MAEPGVVRRVIIPFVLLALTGLGLVNTYGDATEVRKLAEQTACPEPTCTASLREFSRSPFSHEYVYQVGKGGAQVTVKCARTAIFVGEYRCEKAP